MKNIKQINQIVIIALFVLILCIDLIANRSNILSAARNTYHIISDGEAEQLSLTFEREINDSFAGKLNAVNINGLFKRIMRQKIVNGAVLFGDEDLYALSLIETDLDENAENRNLEYTKAILDKADSIGAYGLYVQHPDKIQACDEPLPYEMSSVNAYRDDFYVSALGSSGYRVLDLRLDEYNCNEFYKTDHHWTVGSAFNATHAIVTHLKEADILKKYGEGSRYVKSEWNEIVYPDSFLGSNGIRVGKYYVGKDDYSILLPNYKTEFDLTINGTDGTAREERSGDFEKVYINPNVLTDSNYNNKYDAYLYNATVENIVINHNANNDLKVLLISDSFSRPLFAFLSTSFKEVRGLDPQKGRYNEDILKYIDEYMPDIIIVMYNYGYFID